MLTRLVVKNFKSIGEAGVDLELKPLTLLIGPNGSGKSSILEAFAILSQNVGHSVGRPEVNLKGDLASFPGIEAIAHKGQLGRQITWELHRGNWGVRCQYRPESGESIETVLNKEGDYLEVRLDGDQRQGYTVWLRIPGNEEQRLGQWDHLTWLQGFVFKDAARQASEFQAYCQQAADVIDEIAGALKGRVFPLYGTRGMVPSEASAGEEARWVRPDGGGLVPVLSLVFGSRKYLGIRTRIRRWAMEFDLPGLTAGYKGASKLASDFRDPKLRAIVNLAFAGHGSRQAVAIITQLFWTPRGSVIMIEEPEISLHPEAQVKLGELFAEAIKKDKPAIKQVIATTHSHFLLLALGRVVQKKLLKPDDIALYHVTKDEGGTKAERWKLSKRGYPLGWPPSFAKVESDLAREWAKALSAE